MDLKPTIRSIPDHPKRGILFRDITTLLGDARAFAHAVDQLAAPFVDAGIDKVAGVEARGFILGGAVARVLGVGFAPVRKQGKLPWRTLRHEYTLEYGIDTLEMHEDALRPGESVLLIDDLIATGGTALAALALVEKLGARVVGAHFVIDLPDLGGLQRLRDKSIRAEALCAFAGH
ncbi:MAG: adenine phosphoribosyltransferase [Terricaulis sp.]